MKFLAIFVCAALISAYVASAAPSDKVDCSKFEEVLDDLGGAQGYTVTQEKYKLATTADELATRCQQATEAIKTLRKYNKECFSSLTQQVFSAILRTRSQMNQGRCAAGTPEAAETVAGTKCLKENAFESVKGAELRAITNAQALYDANIPDDKLRTRRACCIVLSSRKDFIDAAKEKCSKYEKLYTEYIDSYTSEAMGLICPDAEKLECDKLEPLKTVAVQIRYKFFLNPFLKIVKTLDH